MDEKISIAIPTYGREQILLDTISYLLKQKVFINEILILDQTLEHVTKVAEQLEAWNKENAIKWIKLNKPSIPKAMNKALLTASSDILLFLDDDIEPVSDLLEKHILAHKLDQKIWAVVGKVIQPENAHNTRISKDTGLNFQFNSTEPKFISNAMAGNLSLRKKEAIEIGGFDENFIGVAFRFETELAERLISKGGKILFEPTASIKHLRAREGGTRKYGTFLTTFSTKHAVGAYYYFFRSLNVSFPIWDCFKRLFGCVYARFYLRNPWWIPIRFFVELLGFFQALVLAIRGPKFISSKR